VTIRQAGPADLAELTALCLRSKAHWGYDSSFMAAVVDELTLRPAHLGPGLACWDAGHGPVGVVRVSVSGDEADLEDLFVDPTAIGKGLGRRLFDWAADHARAQGALRMGIDSDPFAEPFYLAQGAIRVGEAPSGSIPGRMLPRLQFTLAPVGGDAR
jgi:GNAT superfamily N-acetyltransferase